MKFRAASGRAQRASARQQGSNVVPAPDTATTLAPSVVATTQPPVIDSDTNAMVLDEEPTPVLSRSASSVNLQPQDPPPAPATTKPKRKDKGKGKEVEILPVRVKEEPKPSSLHTPEPANNLVSRRHVLLATVFFVLMTYHIFLAQQRGSLFFLSLLWLISVLRWLPKGLPPLVFGPAVGKR